MRTKKKILYFMPDNPTSGKAGNLTRARQMLDFFAENADSLDVDFFSVSDWGDWSNADIAKFRKIYPGINLVMQPRKISSKKPLQRIFLYKIPNFFHKLFQGTSVDISGFLLKNKFRNQVEKNNYDFIVMSYASWGNLVKNVKTKAYLINDTHDFITAQNKKKANKIGKYFQSEIDTLKLFNEIWTYSVEEEYIFQQFTGKKTTLIPISFPIKNTNSSENKKYDILFVGSRNPHNILGISWFLENVQPLLKNYTVHIIGDICKEIKSEYPNVIKHGRVEDISHFYENAKVAICPMLSGTGIKIKVLEALSYGLPVVTNRRGIDGLKNKTENGCLSTESAEKFADYIVELINDSEFYSKISNEGRKYFFENHSPAIEEKIMTNTFLSK